MGFGIPQITKSAMAETDVHPSASATLDLALKVQNRVLRVRNN